MCFKRVTRIVLVVLVIVLSLTPTVCAINLSAEHSYVVNDDYEQNTIPKAYNYKFTIDGIYEGKRLSQPQDIFVANDDSLYVADTANNRILHLAADGRFLKAYEAGFNGPKGVYADDDGQVYVADTGNKRLVKLSADGTVLKEFPRPTSDLISEDISYEPTKLLISDSGLIYVIVGKEFMSITEDNVFMGYLGAEDIPFSLTNMLVNMFASKEQKKMYTKVQPSAYNNFTIGEDGIVYAVVNKSTEQIKKITSVGENIYEQQFYGEYVFNRSNVMVQPFYADVAVDKNGIVFACESNSRKIYQYDQKGNSISVFGGEGRNDGYFDMPVSLDVNSQGQVMVLDSARGVVQVFEPTAFLAQVLEAQNLFGNGLYDEAYEAWNEIVSQNSGYPLAHDMLGNIEYKRKNYVAAMEHYRVSGNQELYGDAYGKHVHQLVTKNFAWFAVGLIVLVCVGAWALGKLKKQTDKWNRELFRISTEGDLNERH